MPIDNGAMIRQGFGRDSRGLFEGIILDRLRKATETLR
jgi:hypothetical protein